MNSELAQLCALVSHGNAFLSGQAAGPPELFPTNRTFDFVRDVCFVLDAERELHGTTPWFEMLREDACERMSLGISRAMPPFAVAFGGGGVWHIHTGGRLTRRAWYGKWEYDGDFEDQPWRITYVTISCTERHQQTSIALARDQLAAALEVAETFDRTAGVGFVDYFVRARQLLAAPDPATKVTRDLLPEAGYNLEARQLLAAGATSWVFGGMGWWNDFWSEDPSVDRQHEQITQTLFAAVLDAIESAINAFDV